GRTDQSGHVERADLWPWLVTQPIQKRPSALRYGLGRTLSLKLLRSSLVQMHFLDKARSHLWGSAPLASARPPPGRKIKSPAEAGQGFEATQCWYYFPSKMNCRTSLIALSRFGAIASRPDDFSQACALSMFS